MICLAAETPFSGIFASGVEDAAGSAKSTPVQGLGAIASKPAGSTLIHLYSVAAVTDTTGSVVERYGYDAYGASVVLDASGSPVAGNESAVGQPYRFTGRRLDDETGLSYFRARYFDHDLGRFVERDPLGYVDGYSMYSGYYVPNAMDPSGRKTSWESIGKNGLGAADSAFIECDCWRIDASAQADGSPTENLPDPWGRPVKGAYDDLLGSNVSITLTEVRSDCCCDEVGWSQYVWQTQVNQGRIFGDLGYDEGLDNENHGVSDWYDPLGTGDPREWFFDYPGVSASGTPYFVIQYFKAELKCVDDGTVVATVFWYNVSGRMDGKPIAATGGTLSCGSSGGWDNNPFAAQIEGMRESDGDWVK